MRLVYFSPLPWHSFTQRPHEFVQWFHQRTGEAVLWVDPYPTRLPKFTDIKRFKLKQQAIATEIPNWLTIIKPRCLPIEPLPGSGWLNRLYWRESLKTIASFVADGPCQIGIGKPSELALQVLAMFPEVRSFYDAMDDFPAFYAGLSQCAMQQREQAIAAKVNKILVSSSALYARWPQFIGKMSRVFNACAINRLPPVQKPLHGARKIILGYVGTIADWFDWSLVCQLAQQLPEAVVRLIGPLYSPPPVQLPANVELLPACAHEVAIRAMQEFSIGLIPFKCNLLTASVDPIKYYEYRALGLPVISTAFGEMANRGRVEGVFHATAGTDMLQLYQQILAYQMSESEIHAFRMQNSWEARFDSSELF
jgi:hypothetical protein